MGKIIFCYYYSEISVVFLRNINYSSCRKWTPSYVPFYHSYHYWFPMIYRANLAWSCSQTMVTCCTLLGDMENNKGSKVSGLSLLLLCSVALPPRVLQILPVHMPSDKWWSCMGKTYEYSLTFSLEKLQQIMMSFVQCSHIQWCLVFIWLSEQLVGSIEFAITSLEKKIIPFQLHWVLLISYFQTILTWTSNRKLWHSVIKVTQNTTFLVLLNTAIKKSYKILYLCQYYYTSFTYNIHLTYKVRKHLGCAFILANGRAVSYHIKKCR